MVSTRRKAAAAAWSAAAPSLDVELPDDVIVDIVGRVASGSSCPMADLHSLRATCKTMCKAAKERYVGKRLALRREKKMKWWDNKRYLAVVRHLARAGNPEACFADGLKDVLFAAAHWRLKRGLASLGVAATGGHRAAAYVLGLLLHRLDDDEARGYAKRYVAQAAGGAGACGTAAEATTNRECKRCRKIAVDAVREATWKKAAVVRLRVELPEDGGHRCKTAACGATQGWGDYEVFCSDGCRISHEYAKFFTEVSNCLQGSKTPSPSLERQDGN